MHLIKTFIIMKKNIFLVFVGLLLPLCLTADPVDKDAARQKAEAFFMKKNPSSARRARAPLLPSKWWQGNPYN